MTLMPVLPRRFTRGSLPLVVRVARLAGLFQSLPAGPVQAITRSTPLDPPIGWSGASCRDAGGKGTSTALWLIKPSTYGRNTGSITGRADRITYLVETPGARLVGVVYPLVVFKE